ncbi:MAG TPA: CCA tRNA nucleotidyltransferase [Gemmatimonadaceae bacterium]|nr:CCA tRNA nucleotidyltransferase [Gemmatimonadaceae bacterium]
MNRLHPPPRVLEIAERLERAGHEAWCVGGAIRDALLGHPHLDWDLATSATPTEVRALFGDRRTIPIGVEFGTVGVLDRDGAMHEVTTFRRDVRTDGRHAEVEFGASLDDDLARRDFTINAIAYSPRLGEIRDPFGGRADLVRRVVRAVGDPEARMREDRLRAIRAIRFAARFGFAIDEPTMRAIAGSAPYLGRLSPERVKQELDKTMEQVRRPSAAFALWQSSGAFATLVPPLANATPRDLSVPDHLAMPSGSARPARRALRFAGLLAGLGASGAERVMTALRSSKHELQLVGAVIGRWERLGEEMTRTLAAASAPTDVDVRRWVAAVGRLQVGAVMRLAAAEWAVARHHGAAAPNEAAVRAVYRRMLRSAFRDPVDLGALAVDGDDLRRVGIPPGPGLGKILQALLAVVIDDPSKNTTDWLLQEAMRTNAALPPDGRGGSKAGGGSDVRTPD